jgi:hypothetical protein
MGDRRDFPYRTPGPSRGCRSYRLRVWDGGTSVGVRCRLFARMRVRCMPGCPNHRRPARSQKRRRKLRLSRQTLRRSIPKSLSKLRSRSLHRPVQSPAERYLLVLIIMPRPDGFVVSVTPMIPTRSHHCWEQVHQSVTPRTIRRYLLPELRRSGPLRGLRPLGPCGRGTGALGAPRDRLRPRISISIRDKRPLNSLRRGLPRCLPSKRRLWGKRPPCRHPTR